MSPKINLTVLDQSPVHPNTPHHTNAAQLTIELAKACEKFGYSRFWVAEHHNSPQFAGPCPEILIASIASVTQQMRVGSGGVMLSHYSPYKVAEVFNMLCALFPDRIDLGIGRAPGGDQLASSALAWSSPRQQADSYPAQASTLKGLLEKNLPADHPWSDLQITPVETIRPELWMLGSGGGSADLAGQLGMNLALARFIAPDHCSPNIFETQERAWKAAGHLGKPDRMLAIGAFCAATQEEAELLASTAIYRKMMMQYGEQDSLLPPEVVQDRRKSFSPSQEAQYLHLLEGYTVGSPEQCKTEIEEMAHAFNTDEIAVVTVTHDFKSKEESYRLLLS